MKGILFGMAVLSLVLAATAAELGGCTLNTYETFTLVPVQPATDAGTPVPVMYRTQPKP